MTIDPDSIDLRKELRDLVLGLYEDDKPRHRRIRHAARVLVALGETNERIIGFANMIDP